MTLDTLGLNPADSANTRTASANPQPTPPAAPTTHAQSPLPLATCLAYVPAQSQALFLGTRGHAGR